MTAARNKIFTSQRQLAKASEALATQCRIMRAIYARTGTPPMRDFAPGFAGLAQIVTGQQLSAASAAAIWSRVEAALAPFESRAIAAMPDLALTRLGLSSAKVRTLKGIARAIENDGFDMARLEAAPDCEIIARLTALTGIGPWTADIYLLFVLRRADAFPAGDLALQLAAQRLFDLKDRPAPGELTEIAERWRPYRGAAARLLWADYALARQSARKRAAAPAQSRSKA